MTSGSALRSRVKFLVLLSALPIIGFGAFAALPREKVIGAYSTSLKERTYSQRHNARLALSRIVEAEIPPGEVFSFNEHVGTFSRDAGFRKAPVSYNGQLIDDWGGGVCQTSTTLYNAALLAGMQILERNRHRFQPSYVPPGRDAAVAFSNIDLRFRNPYPFAVRIEGEASGGRLQLRLVGNGSIPTRPEVVSEVKERTLPETYVLGTGTRRRVRNSGKAGYEVTVYRITGDRREKISHDDYPAMNRIVEVR